MYLGTKPGELFVPGGQQGCAGFIMGSGMADFVIAQVVRDKLQSVRSLGSCYLRLAMPFDGYHLQV